MNLNSTVKAVLHGILTQLVECLFEEQVVLGSNPRDSTINNQKQIT
tara:strand:+ start:1826 stop:1963 length:138 start_codon:yes stop_codon:yes gene_type:complete